MPKCLKCGAELAVNEEGVAPVLCDRCAGKATSRARLSLNTGALADYPATTTLLVINLAVFLGMVFTGAGVFYFKDSALVLWGANVGPLTLGGEYWRLVTANFVHGNLMHIAFNMWCLWSLGRVSERLFGKWQTFLIYLLTGVGGALLSLAPSSFHSEVGASGAIFGIAGALLAGLKFGNLSVPAWERKSIISSMVFFVVINFALGAGAFGFGGNIDNMAHLGGFVTGLLIGLPLGAFARHHKLYQLATILVTAGLLFAAGRELVQKHGGEGLAFRVNSALSRGDYATAIPLLEQYTASNPNSEEGFLILGQVYERTQQRNKAVAAFQQALRINPNSADAKAALEELLGPNSSGR
jgi:membrane associated rhomboid family serine protease